MTGRRLVRDEPETVRDVVLQQAGTVDVVIATGGTGLTSRDSTYEAIAGVLHKRIDGFGELFRALSFAEIGSAAMLSRACAGTIDRTAIFSLPGSENAVRLAMTRLDPPRARTHRPRAAPMTRDSESGFGLWALGFGLGHSRPDFERRSTRPRAPSAQRPARAAASALSCPEA